MGIELNPYLRVNSTGSIPQRQTQVRFGTMPSNDRFESSLPERFTTEQAVTKLINSNPKISSILKESGIPLNINYASFKPVLDNHCRDVQRISKGRFHLKTLSMKKHCLMLHTSTI